jgi:branched-chain amino acid transport system substrate-binding protein
MVKVTRRTAAAGAVLLAFGLAGNAFAQAPVKIGVIYPLSGNSASAGNYSKSASELGAEIVNNGNAELAKILPFISPTGGLPGLKGAKIQLAIADNQGTPAAGANQTLRLITQEKVVGVVGSYQSGITETASAIARSTASRS